ncbi:unnamed protein product [Porites evermanni]|uniref:F5/8 type C domain-containing protein n=1 Tax=Porites evermanni TaxID=104178 RepID=A0ABN8RAR4_9CNID|nr:unnamed protein product [Porites evermanni]
MKGEPGESISSPKVTVSSSHLTVNESNTAVLLCSVSGNPVPQLAWSRVGGVFPSNRTKVSSEGLLQFNKVRLEDAGTYKCVARNILGREEKRASLVVESQPKISLSFGPSHVIKGKNITLPVCHVTGFPSPKITWRKNPGSLVQARTLQKDGRLSVLGVKKSDSGLYKCEASNVLGHDSAVTQLNVVELPRFTVSPPSQLEVSVDQNITVRCQAAGDPQPTITWRKEGGKLPAERSSVSADGTLKIWNLREREDPGRYTCVASSDEIFKATFSTMKVTLKSACVPLGVASKSSIPDARMTASTYYNYEYYPYYGRLNGSRGHGAWCTDTTTDRTDYLQVDMGKEYTVCAVATQGHKDSRTGTTSYKLHFSSNAITWNTYNENNEEKVFSGNQDRNTIVKHSLRRNVKARFVRFYPVSHYTHPCLRVEIFVLK